MQEVRAGEEEGNGGGTETKNTGPEDDPSINQTMFSQQMVSSEKPTRKR